MNDKEKRVVRLLLELAWSMPCFVFEGEYDEDELVEAMETLQELVKE